MITYVLAVTLLFAPIVAAAQPRAETYGQLVTRYQRGEVDAALHALTRSARFDVGDVDVSVDLLMTAVHDDEQDALHVAPRLRAMAALHTEAYFIHARDRLAVLARRHQHAATIALDALDALARGDPRIRPAAFRQLIEDVHALQLGAVGDHDGLTALMDVRRRAGSATAVAWLALAASAERWSINLEAWAGRTDGRQSFDRWHARHLAQARDAAEAAFALDPDDEQVTLRHARLRLLTGAGRQSALDVLRGLGEHASLMEVRYLAWLFVGRALEVDDTQAALDAYRRALDIARAPSACAAVDMLIVLGQADEGCLLTTRPAIRDPWPDFLTGEMGTLASLTVRMRAEGRAR